MRDEGSLRHVLPLTDTEFASPLAKRPCNLRYAAISLY